MKRSTESQYLMLFDFDNTAAMTAEPGPNKIGVREAYDLAVERVFGDRGLEIYQESGGLKNRAPTELVSDLIQKDEETLIKNARIFFEGHFLRLLSIMPEDFSEDSFLTNTQDNLNDLLTWMLVTEKCSHMIGEIGKKQSNGEIWPRPAKGFIDFYKLATEDENNGFKIRTAIVSSGHREFIRRTFDVYGLEEPHYMVTDDDMRKVNLPIWRKTKPSPYLFATIHNQWLKDLTDQSRVDKTGMIYFGDDPIKDGLMAERCRVPFGLYNESLGDVLVNETGGFKFGNWESFGDLIVRHRNDLAEGKSWLDIINNDGK